MGQEELAGNRSDSEASGSRVRRLQNPTQRAAATKRGLELKKRNASSVAEQLARKGMAPQVLATSARVDSHVISDLLSRRAPSRRSRRLLTLDVQG
jgi:hypothetical protein